MVLNGSFVVFAILVGLLTLTWIGLLAYVTLGPWTQWLRGLRPAAVGQTTVAGVVQVVQSVFVRDHSLRSDEVAEAASQAGLGRAVLHACEMLRLPEGWEIRFAANFEADAQLSQKVAEFREKVVCVARNLHQSKKMKKR